jgi:hypothetical protein
MNTKVNSTAAQHRIDAAFPKMSKWADYPCILSLLVAFFEGEKIRVNNGWSISGRHISLLSNVEGRHVLKVLQTAGVRISFGNDAPRGGAAGEYFQCLRKSSAAASHFRALLDEVKAGK